VGGSGADYLSSVAVDGAGNIIVVGQFSGAMTGLESPAINLTSNGSSDGIVIKYNAFGGSQWAQRVGGSGADYLSSVAVDGTGNVIVAGQFSGTTTGLESPAINPTSNGSSDGIVIKYNASGGSQWAQRIGGSSVDYLRAVAVDGSGNVVVVGTFAGTTTGLSSPASNVTSGGYYDAVVVKYNASGESQWAQRFGGSGGDHLNSVAVDGSGNVLAVGRFNGVTSGLSSPASNITSSGSSDGIVVKYDASGASQWAHGVGGDGVDTIEQLHVRGNSVWVIGQLGYNSLSVSVGDRRITPGGFVIGWTESTVVTPVAASPASMAWGASVAANNGVALGSSAYANAQGSAAFGAASATAQNAFASGTSVAVASGSTAMGLYARASGQGATSMLSHLAGKRVM
jgi:hypothetical protein